MAKGQQRSNKETRKPKKDKPAVASTTTSTFLGAGSQPAGGGKKK